MSTNKFEYWPSDGQLGSTKFTMPVNAEDWPSGDALIGNFVYSEGELVDLVDIKALKPNTSKSTTVPYDYVNIELPFAEDAMTINRGPRNKYLIIKFNDEEAEEGDILDSITLVDTLDLKISAATGHIPKAGTEYIDSLVVGDEVEFKFDTADYMLWTTKDNIMSTPAIMFTTTLAIGGKNCDNHLEVTADYGNITNTYCKYTFTESCLGESNTMKLPLPNTVIADGKGMCLAGSKTAATADDWIAKLKYLKIDNLADMVPAIHKDGRKGMYCKIRNIFIPVKTI